MAEALIVQTGQGGLFVVDEADYANIPTYLGQLQTFGGLSKTLGSPTPIRIMNPASPGERLIVGYIFGENELPTAPIAEKFHPSAATYIETMDRKRCPILAIWRVGQCSRPDSLQEWESALIYEGARLTDLEIGELLSTEGQSEVMISGNWTMTQAYRVFAATFSEKAADEVFGEVLDIIYADERSCGGCTALSDGLNKIYAITKAQSGSPGLSSQLVWTIDGGVSWTRTDIAALGGVAGNAITAVGNYLVIVSEAAGYHVYIPKGSISSDNFTTVTSGYNAVGATPRCIYAGGGDRVIIGGALGYIYLSEDITTSVDIVEDGSASANNVNKIAGEGLSTIVAVGDSNTIWVSTNGGRGYALLQTDAGLNGPEAGANLTAVAVLDRYNWYVGTNTGKLWRTGDQGATWTQRTLPNQNQITVINDIKFSPLRKSHGVLSCETSTGAAVVAKVMRTISGGRQWYDSSPAVSGIPTGGTAHVRFNAVALADVYGIAIGGLANGSADGVIMIAEATGA